MGYEMPYATKPSANKVQPFLSPAQMQRVQQTTKLRLSSPQKDSSKEESSQLMIVPTRGSKLASGGRNNPNSISGQPAKKPHMQQAFISRNNILSSPDCSQKSFTDSLSPSLRNKRRQPKNKSVRGNSTTKIQDEINLAKAQQV